MIAGDINRPYKAASHIMDRLEKCRAGLPFFVWLDEQDRVNYASGDSSAIVPNHGLVGTYVRKKSIVNNITAMQICEDIEAM